MSLAKITGKGYEYLLRHIARGDVDPPARGQDPVTYYTAAGNPPGPWAGSGATRLGLREGQEVTENQMRNLFRLGAHPATGALLGRPFNDYKPAASGRQKTAVAGPVAHLLPARQWAAVPGPGRM